MPQVHSDPGLFVAELLHAILGTPTATLVMLNASHAPAVSHPSEDNLCDAVPEVVAAMHLNYSLPSAVTWN